MMHGSHERGAARGWLRETQKGYIRLAVLMLLSKRHLHGYEIMKEIEAKTLGFWRPTAGGVYPILRKLEEEGHVKSEWFGRGRRRRIYHITDKGRKALDHALHRHNQVAQGVAKLYQEFTRDVLGVEEPLSPAPGFFLKFLDVEPETPEEELKTLRRRRETLDQFIRRLQRQRELLEGRIERLGSLKSGEA